MNDPLIPRLALTIPILAIFLFALIPILTVLCKHVRRRSLLMHCHLERMAAIEKGIEIPALPETLIQEQTNSERRGRGTTLLRGLILLFLGVSIILVFREQGREEGIYGLVPAGLGLAYLAYYLIEGRKLARQDPRDSDGPPPIPAEVKP